MTDEGTPVAGKPYSDEDKVHLFLAYFGLLSLVPFLMFKDKRSDPQKEYVYWHGREGLALCIVETVAIIVLAIVLGVMITILAKIAGPIAGILSCLLWPVLIVLFWLPPIMGWIKAFKGVKWEIPVVHKVAEMFK